LFIGCGDLAGRADAATSAVRQFVNSSAGSASFSRPATIQLLTATFAAQGSAMPSDVNVLALVKGQDRYVYVYDDDSQTELIDAIRDHAADPNLSMTWFDATVLTRRAREQVQNLRPLAEVQPRV
jgi:hypothetical protein